MSGTVFSTVADTQRSGHFFGGDEKTDWTSGITFTMSKMSIAKESENRFAAENNHHAVMTPPHLETTSVVMPRASRRTERSDDQSLYWKRSITQIIVDKKTRKNQWVDLSYVMQMFKEKHNIALTKRDFERYLHLKTTLQAFVTSIPELFQNSKNPSQYSTSLQSDTFEAFGEEFLLSSSALGPFLRISSEFLRYKAQKKQTSLAHLQEVYRRDTGMESPCDRTVQEATAQLFSSVAMVLSALPGVVQKGPDAKPRFYFCTPSSS